MSDANNNNEEVIISDAEIMINDEESKNNIKAETFDMLSYISTSPTIYPSPESLDTLLSKLEHAMTWRRNWKYIIMVYSITTC